MTLGTGRVRLLRLSHPVTLRSIAHPRKQSSVQRNYDSMSRLIQVKQQEIEEVGLGRSAVPAVFGA